MTKPLVNAFLSEDTNEVVLLYRDAAGTLLARRRPAEWSVFVRGEDFWKTTVEDVLRQTTAEVLGYRADGEFVRVRARDRASRYKVIQFLDENEVKHFEGDVSPVRRFISDETDVVVQRPRLVYLDIETDSRKTFVEARDGKARVLCWTICGEDGVRARGVLEGSATDAEAVLDDAEEALLEALWKAIEPYDCVLAWNLDEFDKKVVVKRSHLLGVRHRDERGWLWLDWLELFARMNKNASESGAEKRSMRLEDVGQEFLDRGKTKTPPEVAAKFGNRALGALTWELWAEGGAMRRLMVDYCADDTDLLPDLEKATGYIAIFLSLCELIGAFAETLTTNPTIQLDAFMLRLAGVRGHRFPTKVKKFEEDKKAFRGAFVMEPQGRGILRDVHVCDFAGMYPSIMMSFNMSPETKRAVNVNGPVPEGHCRTPSTRTGFVTSPRGILSYAFEKLRGERTYWTKLAAQLPPGTPEWADAKRKADAIKVIINAGYGVVSSEYSRFHDEQIGEATTQTGVYLIKQTNAAAEERGWKVVWTHTDSAFVQGPTDDEFRAFVAWCNAELYPPILKECGCVANYVELAYEKKFERLVFTSAARYCGWFSHFKGKRPTATSFPEVKGLEYRRGDVSVLAARLQIWVIGLLTYFGREDVADFVPVVEAMRTYVLAGELPAEDIVQSKSLSKEILGPKQKARSGVEYYKQRTKADGTAVALPPHVVIAMAKRARGEEVRLGTRIEFYVRDASTTPTTYAPIDEYAGDVDRHDLWESKVWPPTERLLSAAFPDHDWGAFGKTRPRKERGAARKVVVPESGSPVPRRRSAAKKVDRNVLNLFAAPPAPTDENSSSHLTITVLKDARPETLEELRAVLARHPGKRPVEVVVRTGAGDGVLDVRRFPVADTPELRADLARVENLLIGV